MVPVRLRRLMAWIIVWTRVHGFYQASYRIRSDPGVPVNGAFT